MQTKSILIIGATMLALGSLTLKAAIATVEPNTAQKGLQMVSKNIDQNKAVAFCNAFNGR